MTKILGVICLLFCFSITVSAQTFSGTVTDEEQHPLAAVMVFNVQTEKKAFTTINGEFTIEATAGNELRFIRAGFDRSSKVLKPEDFLHPFMISILRTAQDIEEVQLPNIRLTGDLNTDARNLTRFDKVAQLRAEIGVPAPPEKPRETPPPTLEKAGILAYAASNLNLNTLYKNISGDGRRMRSLYRYEDLQDNIAWIRSRIDDDYFTKMGVPEGKISEFLQFSIGLKPSINKWIKAKNLSGILIDLEETFPKYPGRSVKP